MTLKYQWILTFMRKLYILALTVALSAANAVAASPAAVFHGSGQITVNGAQVDRSTTVFSGDQIQTGEGAGTISANGSSVLVHKSTQLVFGQQEVTVLAGGATVKTSSALNGRILGVKVVPAALNSRFTMATEANKIYITALEGSLMVADKISVPEGKTVILAAAVPHPQSNCVDNKKVDENGKFILDNVGRFISCIDQNDTAGGPIVDTTHSHIGLWTGVAMGSAGAAGGISAAIIAQENKTDK